jgi:hypothetical protein
MTPNSQGTFSMLFAVFVLLVSSQVQISTTGRSPLRFSMRRDTRGNCLNCPAEA